MDIIVSIFSQLGANESILYQFVVFFAVFVVAKFTFVDHLQKVLETRVDRTTKLASSAEDKLVQVTTLEKQYNKKYSEVSKKLKEEFDTKKVAIIKVEEGRYREKETEFNKHLDEKRNEILKEIEGKKGEVLSQVDKLSEDLVQRITE